MGGPMKKHEIAGKLQEAGHRIQVKHSAVHINDYLKAHYPTHKWPKWLHAQNARVAKRAPGHKPPNLTTLAQNLHATRQARRGIVPGTSMEPPSLKSMAILTDLV